MGCYRACRDVGFWAVIGLVGMRNFGLLQGLYRRGILSCYRVCRDVGFWVVIGLVEAGFWAVIGLVETWDFGLL